MGSSKLATFVISIDLEMSWGAIHHGRPHDAMPYAREREVVADVLDLMSHYGISATWAVVGHLFLDSCVPVGGKLHPEIVRPEYPWFDGDWYGLDPGETVQRAPTWYGPDLVAAIRECPVPQEVASHSFGHLIAGDPGCSAEAFRSDLDAARNVAQEQNVELRSFVFPRNSIGHLDELADAGFTSYRGPMPPRFENMPGWARKPAALADTIWPLPGSAVTPKRNGRLVDVPQTYLFDPGSKKAELMGTRLWSTMVKRRLGHAVRTSSLFHLWFHTHNLATRPERAHHAMEALFREARAQIDAGRLENATMQDVVEAGGAHDTNT